MDALDHWYKCGRERSKSDEGRAAARGVSLETSEQLQGRQVRRFPRWRQGDAFSASTRFFLRDSRDPKHGKKCTLQAQFPPRRIVPFLQRVRPAAAAPRADRDGINAQRQWDICVRG